MAEKASFALTEEQTAAIDEMDRSRAGLALAFEKADHAFHQAIYQAMRERGLTDAEIRSGRYALDMSVKPFLIKLAPQEKKKQ